MREVATSRYRPNTALLPQIGGDVSPLAAESEALRRQGASVMHLAVDQTLAGLLAVSDPIKFTTVDALALPWAPAPKWP